MSDQKNFPKQGRLGRRELLKFGIVTAAGVVAQKLVAHEPIPTHYPEPSTESGISPTDLGVAVDQQSVADAVTTLAADLHSAASGKGDALIGVKSDLIGSVARTQHQKNAETVSVKDFGAVGNGVIDDSAAIQAAINSGASTVFYPEGTYLIGSPLSVVSFQEHKGSTGGGAELTSSGIIFTHTTTQQFITLDGLRFGGSGKAFYQANNNVYTTNLKIRNCFFGQTLQECIYATLLIADIHDNHFGVKNGKCNVSHRHIYCRGDKTGSTAVNLNTFKNNRFNASTADSAIYIEYGTGNSFLFNDVEGNNNITAAIRINAGGISNFFGNWFESNSSAHQIYFEDAGAGVYKLYYNRSINFDGNTFVLLISRNTYVFYLAENSMNLAMQGNSLYSNHANVNLTDTPSGSNAGVIKYLNNNVYSGVMVAGVSAIASNYGASFGSGVFGSGTSASAAKLIARDNSLPFRCEDLSGTTFLYVGANGQICTGVGANSPYNSTTAMAANLVVLPNGILQRSTSAAKYKTDVRDLESHDISKLRAVRYKSVCESDDKTLDHFGLIADEVLEAGLKELVLFGADGTVEGLQYERLTAVLLKALQDLRSDFESYKASHP